MARIFLGRGKKKIGSEHSSHRKPIPEIVMPIVMQSDILLEILDARFIQETRNKEIEEKIKERGKVIIYIINKADLVDNINNNFS